MSVLSSWSQRPLNAARRSSGHGRCRRSGPRRGPAQPPPVAGSQRHPRTPEPEVGRPRASWCLQALPGRTLRQALRTRTTLIPAGGDILALLDRLPPELEHGTPRQSWLDKAPHYAAAIGDRLAPRPPRAIRAGTIPRRSPPRVPVTRPSTARRPRRLPRPPRRRPRRWTALHPLRPLRCRRTAPLGRVARFAGVRCLRRLRPAA
jgi:hypothetical protein